MTKTKIFEELAITLGGKEHINEQNFTDLVFKNRTKVREILKKDTTQEQKYKNQDSNTSWYLFLADFREHLGLPRFMDLDTFNAFTEVIMISGENFNYDDFLKTFKKSQAKSKITQENSQYNGPKVDKLIKNQGEYLAQGLVELVANAIDATVPTKSIGRFGEGFYQSLKFLSGGDAMLLVQTKKSGEKAFELSLREENGINKVGSVGIEKNEIGTTVQLQKKLSGNEQEELKSFLISRFKTNKKTRVILNGNLVNNLGNYIYYNGEGLSKPEYEVFIEVNENGFRVSDNGVGMSARDLSEKLLSPNMSSKTRLNAESMTYEEITQNSKNETSFFYNHFTSGKKLKENNVEKTKQTLIRLQVGGVLIEEFLSPTSYDIEEFCLEFPSFTWLPESRNKIELTKEVVVSLKNAMEKISSHVSDKKEQLMLLEIIAKIIKHLKTTENSSASNDAKYDIGKIAKQTFKTIKQDLEKEGKTVIAAIAGIQDIIPESNNIVFIDEELAKFEISKIPNIQKLTNITNKKRDFYALEFSEKANYDYLILSNAILVNAKYIKDQRSLDLVNTQVNLNTGYEQGEDKVFYGIIEYDVSEQEKKKKQKGSEKKKIQYSPDEKEIIFAKFEKISDDFEFQTGKQIDELREYFISIGDAITENRSARIEFFLSNSVYKITFFILNKLNFRSHIHFSEETYKKFYDFVQNTSEKTLKTLLMFFQKIQYLRQAERYVTQIIDLLSDEKNASSLLQYLELFESVSLSKIDELFAKFKESEVERYKEVSATKKMLFNIKKYLKENNFVFGTFLEVGEKGNFFLITTQCGKQLFFHNDMYINLFDGNFSNLSDVHIGLNGDLRGIAEIEGNEILFKDNGNTVIKIPGVVTEYGGLHTGPNGDLRGIVLLNGEEVLFKDDGKTIIEIIGGEKYSVLEHIHTGPDGDLRGNTEIDGKEVLFKDDGKTIIEMIDGEKYSLLDFVHTGPDGDLRGIAEIDGKEVLFKDDGNRVIETIGGKGCIFYDIHTGPDGDLRGNTEIDGKEVLFKDDGKTIIEMIDGEKYSLLDFVHTGPDGDLRGIAEIDGKEVLFKDDGITLIETIGGEMYLELDNIHTGANGDLMGSTTGCGLLKIFIGNIIIEDFFLNHQESEETITPRKLESFVEFLCEGGEFLQEQQNKVAFDSDNSILLTDLIGISRFFPEGIEKLKTQERMEAQTHITFFKRFWNKIFLKSKKQKKIIAKIVIEGFGNPLEIIGDLKQKVSQRLVNKIPYQRQITSTIDGQDRASMIWLREVVQNSRDAILKSRKNGNQNEDIGNIEVDFYQNNASWISRITDNVGMNTYEVFKYLLTPGVSGKTGNDGSTGMFGQGFYSLMIGAKALNLKTSTGNGQTTYVRLTPKYNDNKDIIDFEINYDVKKEKFTGTIIERIDENEGIGGSIGALIGINNLEKYVGNVDDVNILYNSQNMYSGNSVKLLEIQNISGFGTLALKQNKDKQERLTKDNLFLSEIKDEYLNFLPDFMVEYVRQKGYSLDLPGNIGLTKTRNAITDFEKNLEILKPHIFHLITCHIVKEYLSGNIRLPMMPLDYYGLDLYEMQFKKEIVNLASKVNAGKNLTSVEILQLKDRGLMIQYLIYLQVKNNGEVISIRELKKRRDDEAFLKKHTQDTYVINHNAESLNKSMEMGVRKSVSFESAEEKTEVGKFIKKLNGTYGVLVNKIFGCSIKFGVYERIDTQETRSVDYGFDKDGNIYFHFNVRFLPKFMNFKPYELIELMTHEFTHLLEDYVKGYGINVEEIGKSGKNLKELSAGKAFVGETSFGTHQKDLDHSHSFEKIQRDILKMMTRERI